jgi:O-antigen/teichoic acid export membrane protein
MSIQKHIASTFGTRFLSIILSFVTSIFFTRLLGVDGKGEFAIFLASTSLFTLILSFGLPSAIVYYVSKNEIDISKLLTTFIIGAIVIGTLFGLVEHFIQQRSQASIFLHRNRSSILYEFLLVLNLILNFISITIRSILSSKKEFSRLNLFEISFIALGLVVYGTLFLLNYKGFSVSVEALFITYTALSLTNLVAFSILFFKTVPVKLSFSFLDRSALKLLISFASLAYLGNIVQFLNYSADLWLVDYFTDSKQLGVYALSANLSQMLWVLPQSIASVLFPYIATGEDSTMLKKTVKLGKLTAYTCVFVAFFSFILIESVIVMVYGEPFRQSAYIFNILLLGTIPYCLTVIYSSYFSGINKQHINMYSAIIGVVLTIVLDLVLIPKYGNIGAAWASSSSYFASTLFILFHILKESKLSLSEVILFTKEDIQLMKTRLNIKTPL